jgi:hypothetical protein
MPKDATKNVDRYKIRGGQLNEFDFHQNQEEFAEQKRQSPANLIPGTPPEQKVEGLRPVVAAARKPAKKKATKATKTRKGATATKGTKSTKAKKATKGTKATKSTKARKAPVGATAKKLAARKAAKKTTKAAKKTRKAAKKK